MSFWNSKRIKKARKEHRCQMCYVKISVGDSCYNEVGTYNGDFNNYHLCDRCHDLIKNDREQWLGDDRELLQLEDCLIENGYLDCPCCKQSRVGECDYTDDRHLMMHCLCGNCDWEYDIDLSLSSLLSSKLN